MVRQVDDGVFVADRLVVDLNGVVLRERENDLDVDIAGEALLAVGT